MTLGDLIKKYREENDLSMSDFAEKSGLSKAYVSLLEKNKNPKTGKEITPSVDIIKKVADAIGMDFDDVFSSIDSTTKIVVNRSNATAYFHNSLENFAETAAKDVFDKQNNPIVLDDEALELLEELKTRPEMRTLFSVSKKATKEDILKAVKIIEALKGDD